MNNSVILKQMIRLSKVIKQLKEARCKSSLLLDNVEYFILKGELYSDIQKMCNDHIAKCLYLEKNLRLSVRGACKFLDGFDKSTMDPIDYISSSDVKNKRVDICRNKNIVAAINLVTGEIELLKPENENLGEDKSSVEKSQ